MELGEEGHPTEDQEKGPWWRDASGKARRGRMGALRVEQMMKLCLDPSMICL
jgi:hypothetical protein